MILASTIFKPLLLIHVLSGIAALLAGIAAIAFRKGRGGGHARAGNVFTVAMSVMAITAAILTAWEPDRLSLGAAVWAFYLVHTARHAATDRGNELPWTMMGVGLTASLLFAHGGWVAHHSVDGTFEGAGVAGYLVFGIGTAISLLLDLSLLRRPVLRLRQRIGRHLWRMMVAYFLAVTSLFLGQQDDVFPFMQGSPLLFLPSLLTIGFLGFWLVRVRFTRNWLGDRRAARREGPHSQLQRGST